MERFGRFLMLIFCFVGSASTSDNYEARRKNWFSKWFSIGSSKRVVPEKEYPVTPPILKSHMVGPTATKSAWSDGLSKDCQSLRQKISMSKRLGLFQAIPCSKEELEAFRNMAVTVKKSIEDGSLSSSSSSSTLDFNTDDYKIYPDDPF